MTNYHLKPPADPPTSVWQTARAKRRQVLEAVRKRRAQMQRNYRLKAGRQG